MSLTFPPPTPEETPSGKRFHGITEENSDSESNEDDQISLLYYDSDAMNAGNAASVRGRGKKKTNYQVQVQESNDIEVIEILSDDEATTPVVNVQEKNNVEDKEFQELIDMGEKVFGLNRPSSKLVNASKRYRKDTLLKKQREVKKKAAKFKSRPIGKVKLSGEDNKLVVPEQGKNVSEVDRREKGPGRYRREGHVFDFQYVKDIVATNVTTARKNKDKLYQMKLRSLSVACAFFLGLHNADPKYRYSRENLEKPWGFFKATIDFSAFTGAITYFREEWSYSSVWMRDFITTWMQFLDAVKSVLVICRSWTRDQWSENKFTEYESLDDREINQYLAEIEKMQKKIIPFKSMFNKLRKKEQASNACIQVLKAKRLWLISSKYEKLLKIALNSARESCNLVKNKWNSSEYLQEIFGNDNEIVWVYKFQIDVLNLLSTHYGWRVQLIPGLLNEDFTKDETKTYTLKSSKSISVDEKSYRKHAIKLKKEHGRIINYYLQIQKGYLEYKEVADDIVDWHGRRVELQEVFMVNLNSLKPITVQNVNTLLKSLVAHNFKGEFNDVTVHILRKHYATYAYKRWLTNEFEENTINTMSLDGFLNFLAVDMNTDYTSLLNNYICVKTREKITMNEDSEGEDDPEQ